MKRGGTWLEALCWLAAGRMLLLASRVRRGRGGLCVCLFLLLLSSCKAEKPHTVVPAPQLSLATTLQSLSALLWIAEHDRFTAGAPLDLKLVPTWSGVEAYSLLAEQKVDLAVMTAFAYVKLSLTNENMVILSVLAVTDNNALIVNRQRGIEQIADLKHKVIGVAKHSSADYFFSVFAAEHGLQQEELTLRSVPPSEQVAALQHGTIDALASWAPLTVEAQQSLGNKAKEWSLQGLEKSYWLLVADKRRLPADTALDHLFRSLEASERFIAQHEEQALTAVATRLKLPRSTVESSWSHTTHGLSLPADLITSMEFRAHWISTQTKKPVPVPNYLRRISFAPLERVKPAAITIIHE